MAADAAKSQAESIAMSMAGTQVVSNQIAVIPPGAEHDAKKVNSDLDKGYRGEPGCGAAPRAASQERKLRRQQSSGYA